MLVINMAVYAISAFFIFVARDFAVNLQVRVTGVPAEEWPRIFVDYLSRYKAMILVFNFAPWLGLVVVY
jgi:hypothetical protein